jgi:hypothetical protein
MVSTFNAGISEHVVVDFLSMSVRFRQNEDPKLLTSFELDSVPRLVALAPQKNVSLEPNAVCSHFLLLQQHALIKCTFFVELQALAVVMQESIRFYTVPSFSLVDTIPADMGGAATDICWTPDGLYLVTFSASEKHARVFRNPVQKQAL